MTALIELIKQYVNTATTATKGIAVLYRYVVLVSGAFFGKEERCSQILPE